MRNKHFRAFSTPSSLLLGVALSFLTATGPVAATEAAGKEPAVIARKAQSSVLLDIVEAGGRWIAVGERGHILYSEDQGASWAQAEVPVASNLTAVYFANAEQGWAVGHDATILATADGGRSWSLQFRQPELEKPFLDVWFRNPLRGIAIGAYGMMMRTEDGGKTWQTQDTASLGDDIIAEPHLNALRQLGDGSLLLAGEAGLVARSNDEGRSWTRMSFPYEGSLFGIGETTGKALLVAGLRGHVFRSVDNGASWQEVSTDVVGALNSVLNTGSGVYVLGNDGIVLRSQDDGRNFVKVQRGDRKAVAAGLADENGLLLVGEVGVKTTDADGRDLQKHDLQK
ncbi:MAG: hypothetical protein HYV16_00875 [Gammaproteobacteria bacterium]|nr:hypothetical protein [Gammaproteobacteria bacterium]